MATYNGLYFRASFPISVGIPFTEDRRVGGRPGDRVSGSLASGNVALEDPRRGWRRAAADEVSRAIAAFVFRRCCPVRKTLNEYYEI